MKADDLFAFTARMLMLDATAGADAKARTSTRSLMANTEGFFTFATRMIFVVVAIVNVSDVPFEFTTVTDPAGRAVIKP